MIPERSWGFLFTLVSMFLAIAAVLLGLALGVAAARYGRGLFGWLLAAYVAVFLAHVISGFQALEGLAVMWLAFVAGPLGYYAGRTEGRPGPGARRRRATAPERQRVTFAALCILAGLGLIAWLLE